MQHTAAKIVMHMCEMAASLLQQTVLWSHLHQFASHLCVSHVLLLQRYLHHKHPPAMSTIHCDTSRPMYLYNVGSHLAGAVYLWYPRLSITLKGRLEVTMPGIYCTSAVITYLSHVQVYFFSCTMISCQKSVRRHAAATGLS